MLNTVTPCKLFIKNTLGDNDKMKVAMRDYDMSTHDISTVFRSSIGVGMLVPFCKILCQKGDIIDLNLINKTLSQQAGKKLLLYRRGESRKDIHSRDK